MTLAAVMRRLLTADGAFVHIQDGLLIIDAGTEVDGPEATALKQACAPNPAPDDGGTYAHRCGTCHRPPAWTLVREGDAVVTWACADDLGEEAARLQRDPRTRLIVTRFPKEPPDARH